MSIGLTMGLSLAAGGGGGGPVSLYDTSDIVFAGTLFGDEVIDADSFRGARNNTGGAIVTGTISGGTPNGPKRIRFDLSAYDGGVPSITLIRVQIFDGATAIAGADYSAAGPIDLTHTFANGSIVFRFATAGRGGRLDNLFISVA